jgi:hypothetical protein
MQPVDRVPGGLRTSISDDDKLLLEIWAAGTVELGGKAG